MKNKKALSTVVSVVIIILLVVAAGGVVFAVVRNLANENLDNAKDCFNLFEEVTLNDDYTCYNSTGDYVEVSISRKELAMDFLLISISSETESFVFNLYDEEKIIEGVTNYGIESQTVKLPGNESGKTYLVDWSGISENPVSVKISPSINGKQCGVLDEILNVVNCF